MIKWKKKNGVIVETNGEQASIDAAVKLGWKQHKKKEPKAPKK